MYMNFRERTYCTRTLGNVLNAQEFKGMYFMHKNFKKMYFMHKNFKDCT